MALVARIRIAPLVRVEISKLYHLVDCAVVTAADLFALSQTNGGRTALFRSHTCPALDDVDTILRSDCGPALRNARGTAGFRQARGARPRPWATRDRSIITALSP